MLLEIVAPWIIEAWGEALSRLAFDLPSVALNSYQAHVAVAAASLALLALTWTAVAHLPAGARIPARTLIVLVLLVPSGAFVARHIEALRAFARDPAASVAEYDSPSRPPAATRSPRTQPLPPATSLPESEPQRQAAVDSAPPLVAAATPPPPGEIVPAAGEQTVAAKEPAAEPSPAGQLQRQAGATAAAAAAALKRVSASLSRMLPRLPDDDLMPVLFGTDREFDLKSSQLDYSADRARQLKLGQALVHVPQRHRAGESERPWAGARAPHTLTSRTADDGSSAGATNFSVYEIKSLSHDEFLQAAVMRLSVSRRYKDQALVYVHGFNTTFEAALFRAAQIAYDLKFDGAPFVYSWPSAGRVPRYDYDSDSAREALPYLTGFLRVVVRETGAKSISIIAHGLGSAPVLEALAALKDELPAGVTLDEVILSAPDLGRSDFEARIAGISGLARHVTLYSASSDRGLNVTRRYVGSVPRAGDVLEGGPMVLGGVDTVDASRPGTAAIGLNHSAYVERSALIADLAARLERNGREPGSSLERVATPNGTYWRLPELGPTH